MADSAQSDFRSAFQRLAQRVHRRHAGRLALTGAGVGLSLGALGALGLWALRWGEWRPMSAGLGALGALVGAALASRQRWSESDIALYLDARLDSHETLTTALAARGGPEPALAHVLERASSVLGSADPKRVKPKLWSRWHALLPGALAVIAVVSVLPLPPAPKPAPHAPGAERVQIENL